MTMGFSLSKQIDLFSDVAIRSIPNCKRIDKIVRKNICSFGIAKKYFDFRDTLTRYYVYLPFAETTELENAKVLGRTLNIQCYFDVRTGSIKYYIFADSCLIKTVGGQVRLDMPVSATNPMAKYSQIRSGSASLLSQGVNAGRKIVGGAIGGASQGGGTGALLGLDAGVLDTILSIPKALQTQAEIQSPMGYEFNGQYSPSTCVDDPLDVYLYTVEPNIIYDSGIRNNYGLPSNVFDAINSHRGFIECDDVRLTGEIPQDDKLEIMQALKNGVYIV